MTGFKISLIKHFNFKFVLAARACIEYFYHVLYMIVYVYLHMFKDKITTAAYCYAKAHIAVQRIFFFFLQIFQFICN